MTKITVIGSGSVGSTIAYTLAVTGIANEIVMIDINQERSKGEAMDINQGTPFCGPVSIYSGTYFDAADSDIVIITSGIPRKPGQSRLDLAQTNIDVCKSIIPDIVRSAPNAFYIIVSNPVDILTYAFCKLSGIPENRIIGSGTILDTARLRTCLSEKFKISQQNVHAYVMGEHGDSSFITWSLANISNIPITEYGHSIFNIPGQIPTLDFKEIEDYVRKSGARVIERKGATFYAISISVCHICKSLLNGMDSTMTVSTMLRGEYGISDVCLSILNVVGSEGIKGRIISPLSDDELLLLQKSAETLKEKINSLNI